MPIEHKPLPYPSDALEPHIDKQTMEIHHGKHYKAYVDNYNAALQKAPQLEGKPLHEVLAVMAQPRARFTAASRPADGCCVAQGYQG